MAVRLLALDFLLARAPAVGDEARDVLELVKALPLRRRGVDLELEEIERLHRRRDGRDEQADERRARPPHEQTVKPPSGPLPVRPVRARRRPGAAPTA